MEKRERESKRLTDGCVCFCPGQEWAYRAAFSTSGEEEESRYYIGTTCVGEKGRKTTENHARGRGTEAGRGSLVSYIYADLLRGEGAGQ